MSKYIRNELIIDRILSRLVEIDRGYATKCWEWVGPTSGSGRGGNYGRMSLNGQTVSVHIVMFTCCFGYIPGKKQIDHLCFNRLCSNPDHLEMVSHIQNQKRRVNRKETIK